MQALRRIVLVMSLGVLACDSAPQVATAVPQPLALSDYGFSSLAAGNNNDWSDGSACFSGSGMCQVLGHASGSTITGLDKSVFGHHGIAVWIMNRGATTITVKNNSGSSSLDNRVHTRSGNDIVLAPGADRAFLAVVDWTTDPYTDAGWMDIGFNAAQDIAVSTPTRSLGTAFQASTTRPVDVHYSVQIDSTITVSGGAAGRIELLSDAANPPTTIRASVPGGITGTAVIGLSITDTDGGELSYTVPVGHFVLIRSVTVSGTPTYSIVRQAEEEWR